MWSVGMPLRIWICRNSIECLHREMPRLREGRRTVSEYGRSYHSCGRLTHEMSFASILDQTSSHGQILVLARAILRAKDFHTIQVVALSLECGPTHFTTHRALLRGACSCVPPVHCHPPPVTFSSYASVLGDISLWAAAP